MPFRQDVLEPNPELRRRILEILEAALAAVDPQAAVKHVLRREGETLLVGERTYDLQRFRRIHVVGAGKAGAPMTAAVEDVLGDRIHAGLVVVKRGHAGPTRRVTIAEAGHPVPDQAGVDAGRQILTTASAATADDLVVALISGGGSALLVAPAPGLSLGDLQGMNQALLACGASIDEINVLRKHCSGVKGGQLARAAAPATLITLVLSDVIGSPLDVIASGPTVPDRSTWEDAWAIVERYDLAGQLPAAVRRRLEEGRRGGLDETPKPGETLFERTQTLVVADNRSAAVAACRRAREQGFNTLLLTTYLDGDAAAAGRLLAALGREVQASGNPVAPPACLVLGGETTVVLGREAGRGGRNQEAALAAALALAGTRGITAVALATDGTDGPTDSAGGLADGESAARGDAAGFSPVQHLRRHDAYPFLQASADLLRSGPTLTNVNDLLFVFVER